MVLLINIFIMIITMPIVNFWNIFKILITRPQLLITKPTAIEKPKNINMFLIDSGLEDAEKFIIENLKDEVETASKNVGLKDMKICLRILHIYYILDLLM